MMMTDDDDLAGAAIGALHEANDRLRIRNAKMLTACEAALEYFERYVELPGDEDDELEDGTICDGRTHEGNLLRAAVSSTKSDAERRRRLGMPAERGMGGSGDETLIHDLECNHAAVNRPGASIYSRAVDEINRLRDAIRKHRDQWGDDRCWLDDAELYGVLGEGYGPPKTLPPREEFLRSCARYWEQRQAPDERSDILPVGCMTIAQLSAEVERLREERDMAKNESDAAKDCVAGMAPKRRRTIISSLVAACVCQQVMSFRDGPVVAIHAVQDRTLKRHGWDGRQDRQEFVDHLAETALASAKGGGR